jgi:phage tail sheath protein FI
LIEATYPGAYVKEVPGGIRPIEGVSTSIAAFFGRTRKGPTNEAVMCKGLSDFKKIFESVHPASDLEQSVKQFFENGGLECYVVRLVHRDAKKAEISLADRSGTTLLVATAKSEGDWGNGIHLEVDSQTEGLIEQINIRVVSDGGEEELFEKLTLDPKSRRYAPSLVTHDSRIIDLAVRKHDSRRSGDIEYLVHQTEIGSDGGGLRLEDYVGDERAQTGFHALDSVDVFNLMVLPNEEGLDLMDVWGPASVYCRQKRAFLLIDAPSKDWTKNSQPEIIRNPGLVEGIRGRVQRPDAAIFYPWIQYFKEGEERFMGPSGCVAGMIARIDSARGVWKSPAGIEADIRGISGLEVDLSDGENAELNKIAVNCIRRFPAGIVNWGVRTMDGSDISSSEWKYIPIRRTALFIEESLYRGTEWVVFEPNDETLWSKIRVSVGAFMMDLFHRGAFQGAAPDKAFFVRCDSGTTTQDDRKRGIVNFEVGFAPLKPAEFIIIRIQQIAG